MGFIHRLITGGGPPCKRVYHNFRHSHRAFWSTKAGSSALSPDLWLRKACTALKAGSVSLTILGVVWKFDFKIYFIFQKNTCSMIQQKNKQKKESLIYQSTRRFQRTKMGLESTRYEEKGTMFIICGIISTNDWTRYARTILPSKECSSKGNVNRFWGQ